MFGEEEISVGTVAVLTLDMTDVLSHVSVRARNSKVGDKSCNFSYIKGKVSSWVGIPTSVALPFGVFEKVLSDDINQVKSEGTKVCMLIVDSISSLITPNLGGKGPHGADDFPNSCCCAKLKSCFPKWQRWDKGRCANAYKDRVSGL